MAAAKPCVAVPFVGDQATTANFMKKLGLAEVVSEKNITADLVTSTTKKVIKSPDYANRAKTVQQKIFQSGGIQQMVDVLEDCAARRRPLKLQNVGPFSCCCG